MQRRVAVARDGGEMVGGGVALVAIVAVARIGGVVRQHLAIARHLGDDRRGGNGAAAAIAVQHAALRDQQVGNAERVDEHEVRQRRERQHGAAHRLRATRDGC